MKKLIFVLLAVCTLLACKDKNIPDVSDIQVNLAVHRFEQDFFTLDTTQVMASLEKLGEQYPVFLGDFLYNIMELPPVTDTSIQVLNLIKKFITDYAFVKDSADALFKNFKPIAEEVKQGLRFVKYYFPAYKLPEKLITFIGPMEGYSDVITREGLAVGLQLHMGSNFSLYQSSLGQSVFPTYISRRFTPNTIAVNCMKNIIDDIAPDHSAGRPLVEQMVEKGKRLYVLNKLMPRTADTLKTGYTTSQLKGCYKNEGQIWNYFLANNLLFNIDPAITRSYMEEAPNTPEMGEGSPGAIGLFVGWRIVEKYMEGKEGLSLKELLDADARKIFEESKYRPN
jgi:hypothetical protein